MDGWFTRTILFVVIGDGELSELVVMGMFAADEWKAVDDAAEENEGDFGIFIESERDSVGCCWGFDVGIDE